MSDETQDGYGLRPVTLADRGQFEASLGSLNRPLSDYTFSQIYTWRNSLHLMWTELAGHLCVFANGSGDLTLLLPPVGDTGGDAAMRQAVELMDDYNGRRGVPDNTRVEYVSDELLDRFNCSAFDRVPMGTDYVYETARMIDLAGGDLASKRQARNRFVRNYAHRVERYDPAVHLQPCLSLLDQWRVHQDAQHLEEPNAQTIKRQKETIATELALRSTVDLGLKGLVVYAADGPDQSQSIRGFTLGEYLGTGQSSILIEKTDLATKGLAQFIFSEFCRVDWSDRPRVNVGDDWGLPSLAWTKNSYRPVELLYKYALCKSRSVSAGYEPMVMPVHPPQPRIRPAEKADLPAARRLEDACFADDTRITPRQLNYLRDKSGARDKSSAVFLVAETEGAIVGQGIALVRRHKGGQSGRIYSLAVDPAHRGKHLGRRLIDGMIDALADRGVSKIYLEVERGNTAAIGLYERVGFKPIGTLADYYGERRDAIHMVRDAGASQKLAG